MFSSNKLYLNILFMVTTVFCRSPRSAEELTRCIRIAEPLIHDPNYVFPLTVTEIRNVCQMWDKFVECVRQYTSIFLSKQQQQEFDSIIGPSMKSIHQLCTTDDEYEKSYLAYAPCMKKVSIEDRFCGNYYSFLAKLAESSQETGPAICCGYHKFRSCVLQEAQNECERNGKSDITSVKSSDFVSSMLNRALGFLVQTCSRIEPISKECSNYVVAARDQPKITTVIPKPKDRRRLPQPRREDSSVPQNPNKPPSVFWASYLPSGNPKLTRAKISGEQSTVIRSTPSPGKRFTWTTTSSQSYFPTRNYSYFGDVSENEIREPERFRGSIASTVSSATLAILLLQLLQAI